MILNKIIRQVCPPFIITAYKKLFTQPVADDKPNYLPDPEHQDLNIYWTPEMAYELENWGKDHAWIEIECLMVNCRGKVLDIACGTGVNILALSQFHFLDLYGFDISELLLSKAKEKGIPASRIKVNDATRTDYNDNEFDYSYSIGSLEHFTEEGILLFLKECSRYTSRASFHMIPVSENNLNNGWIKRGQSYFNNSVDWWLKKFSSCFSQVYVINSGWKDPGVSTGKWFLCFK